MTTPTDRPWDETLFELRTDDQAVLRGRRSGQGPVVVAVHGWTLRHQIWDPVVPALIQAGLQVVAFDLRGHGQSTVGGQAPTVERLSADLSLVLDDLGVDQAVVVGHSLGGATVLHRALTGDRRVVGLAMVASTSCFIPIRALRPAARGVAWWMRSPVNERVMASRAGRLLIRPALGADPADSAVGETVDCYRTTPRSVISDQFACLTEFDARDRLATLSVPTTVLVGALDRLTPPAHARVVAERVPDGELHVLPEAGHMLTLERPDEVGQQVVALAHRAGLATEVTP